LRSKSGDAVPYDLKALYSKNGQVGNARGQSAAKQIDEVDGPGSASGDRSRGGARQSGGFRQRKTGAYACSTSARREEGMTSGLLDPGS